MRLSTIIAFLAIGFGAAFGQSYFEFTADPSFVVGSTATQARATGHLIGSPLPEIVCTQGSSTILIVNIDNPGGPSTMSLSCPANVQSIAVEDIDGDGVDEIIVGRNTSPGNQSGVSIFRSTAPGSYVRTDLAASPAFATSGRVSAVDVTGDGLRDLIWGPRVFPNIGGGNFGPSTLVNSVVPTNSSVAPGDLDGDGDMDLVASYIVSGATTNFYARVLRNNGAGVFTLLGQVNIGGGVIQGFVRIGDFTNDGRDDVLMTGRNGFDVMKARVFAGTASAALSIQPLFESCAENLAGPALADFDGNGALDFASFLRYSDAKFMLFAGNGGGMLGQNVGPGTNHASSSGAAAECVSADFDGDGDPDLAYVSQGSQPPSVRVFRNISNQPSSLSLGVVGTSSATYGVVPGMQVNRNVVFRYDDGAGGFINANAHWATSSFTSTSVTPTLACDSPNIGSNSVGSMTQSFDVPVGSTGTFIATTTSPEGLSTSTMYVVSPSLTVVSGAGQVVCAGQQTPLPVVVNLTANGIPIAGATVEFEAVTTSYIPLTFFPSNAVVTDALGNAQVYVSSVVTGSRPIRAVLRGPTGGAFATPSIAFSAQGPVTVTNISGDNQAAGWPDVYAEPLVAEFRGCTGEPLAGANVLVSVSPWASATTFAVGPVHFTDANGRTSIVIQRIGNAPDFVVTLTLANGTVSTQWGTTFNLKTRSLTATGAPTTVTMSYKHVTPNVPLLFVVDVANGTPPTAISTPFGPIYTSILSPSPNLVYSDGLGIFGPPDPTLITGPTGDWVSTFPRPVPAIGVTFTAQVYGYDASYPDIFDAYFVSNWANFTL